jgi:SAM-dependent methyltransferase
METRDMGAPTYAADNPLTWDDRIFGKLKSSSLGLLIKRGLVSVGYDRGQWVRTIMYRDCFKMLKTLRTETLDALEISPGPDEIWQQLGWRSFTETTYPDFDLCTSCLDRQFDIIIADQVFEHLIWPYRAARNVVSMLVPGGYFIITTPFLIRLHAGVDCIRWSAMGMQYFLAESGFPIDWICASQWGNRRCVKANFNRWARRGWLGSLRNEENFPVTVWAFARKAL